MMRSRSTSPVWRWALLLLLALDLGSGVAARAQPADSDLPVASVPNSKWPWMLGLMAGGIIIGVLGARWLTRKPRRVVGVIPPRPIPKKRAENVPKAATQTFVLPATQSPPKQVSIQSMSKIQGREPRPSVPYKSSPKSLRKPDEILQSSYENQPIKSENTVEWVTTMSTPPAIQELINSTPDETVNINDTGRSPVIVPPDNAKIQAGQGGWSMPPTKPYSHEETQN
ncbi:hypothetical protein MUN81_05830 [Hymenobacter sp. 5317J-9]|uniref:hypothetical protein n=1 Tax=Hymenobacter sp. 5317J-9 TaxID=2932250 RepID=UPI001FD6ED38|nr:hypothetical protein [Hymenobacter sp. 5317J-9]UOQ99009.1 hypothetical protein MUN81_05830 [Hymenobacter sp. 5317J-9]